MGAPTYGTGTTATEQLFNDISSIAEVRPGGGRQEAIAYTPRPELVRPASMEVLPPPQQSAASAQNPAWPESPEQRRARIRDEATVNQDNFNYRSPVAVNRRSGPVPRSEQAMDQYGNTYGDANAFRGNRTEVQARLDERNQGSPSTRRYLSEPPLDYRQPSATAPTGDLGEDERVKEARANRAAGKRTGLRDLLPW